jgi:DNA-directed RNA polymerase subunit RPC12/RpoP
MEQKARWSCSRCGANYSWYGDKCPSCGSKVFSCEDEEAVLSEEIPT